MKRRAGVLLSGKMSFSALHTPEVMQEAARAGFELDYLLDAASDGERHIRFDGAHLRSYLASSRLCQALRLVRRFAVRNASTDIKFRDFIGEDVFSRPSLAAAITGYAGILAAATLPGAGALCRRIESTAFPSRIFGPILATRSYDAALLSSVGNFGFEAEALFARECIRSGIRTVSVVTNYDNFLNRGSAGFVPDKVGVWSKYMGENAVKAGIPASRIEVIGAPSLDPLLGSPRFSREDYLKKLGLDPAKKTILYAGGVLVAQAYEVLHLLIRSGVVGECNLIYRPYPHAKVYGSRISSLVGDHLRSCANVYVTDAEALSSTIDATLSGFKIPTGGVADEKVEQLHASDLVINHFSTFGLEACVLDVPVVQVAYDGPSLYAIRRGAYPSINMRQIHNRMQIQASASAIARSEEELIKHTRSYLANSAIHRDERRRYAEFECGPLDGRSTARMFDLLGNA